MSNKSISSALVLLLLISGGFAQAQDFSPAKKLKDGWEEIDERLIFLMVRLADVEANLDEIDRALAKKSVRSSIAQGNVIRADKANERMDRRGGGPVRWDKFYGTTAERFFYHPTDRHTHHTITILGDGSSTPKRQALPPHQRPPQFDYLYRANESAKQRAVAEIAKLRGSTTRLNQLRHELQLEQSKLWCEIAFRAVARNDLDRRPIYRYAPKAEGNEDLVSAAKFSTIAFSIIEQGQVDQARTFGQIKSLISQARDELGTQWLRLGVDYKDRSTDEWKFAALAHRLEDLASNLSDSYAVSVKKEGERREMYRALLQRALILYAQTVLALDEMTSEMAVARNYEPNLDAPLTSYSKGVMAASAGIGPKDADVFLTFDPSTVVRANNATIVQDVSGKNNHASSRELRTVAGVSGDAASFDDTTPPLVFEDSFLIPRHGSFSVFIWLRTKQRPGQGNWFTNNNRQQGRADLFIKDGRLGWFQSQLGERYVETIVADGQWHHVGVSRTNDGDFLLWVDGKSESIGGKSEFIDGHRWQLGQPFFGWHKFIGELDELAIFRRALQASEVRELMTRKAQPPSASFSTMAANDPERFSTDDSRIDLLALTDPVRDAIRGKWRMVNGALIHDDMSGVSSAEKRHVLQIPYIPPAEYDLRIIVDNDNDSGHVNLSLPVANGTTQVLVLFMCRVDQRSKTRLILNDTTQLIARETDFAFESLTPNEVACKVRRNGIFVTSNGKLLFEYRGDMSLISRSGWSPPDPRAIGISTFGGKFAVSQAELIPISGEGRPLR